MMKDDIENCSAKEIVELVGKWLKKGNRQIVMSVLEGDNLFSLMTKDENTLSAMLYSMMKSDMGEVFIRCVDNAIKRYMAEKPTIPLNIGKYKS